MFVHKKRKPTHGNYQATYISEKQMANRESQDNQVNI
jgi:hypothetical protein